MSVLDAVTHHDPADAHDGRRGGHGVGCGSSTVGRGAGSPRREFLYSEDMAAACIYLMSLPEEKFGALLRDDFPPLVNIGCGEDITIRDLVETVREVVGFQGRSLQLIMRIPRAS